MLEPSRRRYQQRVHVHTFTQHTTHRVLFRSSLHPVSPANLRISLENGNQASSVLTQELSYRAFHLLVLDPTSHEDCSNDLQYSKHEFEEDFQGGGIVHVQANVRVC